MLNAPYSRVMSDGQILEVVNTLLIRNETAELSSELISNSFDEVKSRTIEIAKNNNLDVSFDHLGDSNRVLFRRSKNG